MLPGPGNYQNMKAMADQHQYAKSMLGGSTVKKEVTDTGLGPAAYQHFPQHSIPGFVIAQDTSKVRKEEPKDKEPVGPQRYDPFNPNHKRTDHLKNGNSIGNAKRGDLVTSTNP
jgi:hypothetical protein